MTIAGIIPLPYNGTFTITQILSPTSFTYSDTVTGLAASTQPGTATLAANNVTTITTTAAHNFQVGQFVTVTGVGVAGYNGTFLITSVPTATTVHLLQDPAITNAAASGGGSAAILSASNPTLGSGNVVLQGAEIFTGSTTVNHGTLTVSGGARARRTTSDYGQPRCDT